MKLGPSLLTALAISYTSFSHAQITCPATLKWTDATYAERTTIKKGRVWKAKVENFSEASVVHLNMDGIVAALITVLPQDPVDSIRFTSGRGVPNPIEFSETSMVVEPPMTHGDWPRMTGPCAVPEGVSLNFDQTDVPQLARARDDSGPKFKGIIKREGLGVSYSMEAGGDESWQGSLRYTAALKELDPQTDVQGWHVFRGTKYVETLPAGKPIFVRSVVGRMTGSAEKN